MIKLRRPVSSETPAETATRQERIFGIIFKMRRQCPPESTGWKSVDMTTLTAPNRPCSTEGCTPGGDLGSSSCPGPIGVAYREVPG